LVVGRGGDGAQFGVRMRLVEGRSPCRAADRLTAFSSGNRAQDHASEDFMTQNVTRTGVSDDGCETRRHADRSKGAGRDVECGAPAHS